MTQQTIKQRPTRHIATTNGRYLIILSLLIGFLILATQVGIGLRNQAEVNSKPARALSAIPQDGRAFYTEPYWKMAAELDSAAAAPRSLSALPQDGRAFYTEPYWKMAAELDSVAAAPRNLSALPQDGRAFYTEPYWKMAEAATASASEDPSTVPLAGRAYFTEPYWNTGK